MGTELTDGDDGLPAELVHSWVAEKHAYLREYVRLCAGPRAKTDRPCFIDSFSSCGRSKIEETGEFVDGSPIVAWKESAASSSPYHALYVADIEPRRREACVRRLEKLGAPVVEVDGDALNAVRLITRQMPREPLHLAFLDPHSLGDLSF